MNRNVFCYLFRKCFSYWIVLMFKWFVGLFNSKRFGLVIIVLVSNMWCFILEDSDLNLMFFLRFICFRSCLIWCLCFYFGVVFLLFGSLLKVVVMILLLRFWILVGIFCGRNEICVLGLKFRLLWLGVSCFWRIFISVVLFVLFLFRRLICFLVLIWYVVLLRSVGLWNLIDRLLNEMMGIFENYFLCIFVRMGNYYC